MIRIRKPAAVPEVLTSKGQAETNRLKAAYDAGERRFSFDSDIYGHATVKFALKATQHGKCCYCEAKVDHVAHGDVEHFRPKGRALQTRSERTESPGYYWLAYDWRNLYFSCQVCNQSHKGDLFPLRDRGARCRQHADDLSDEVPLLLDPGNDDPAQYIAFRDEYPFSIENNDRGRETIKVLGLDREPLNERRRERLAIVRNLMALAELDMPQSAEARFLLEAFLADSGEFAAAVRTLVAVPVPA